MTQLTSGSCLATRALCGGQSQPKCTPTRMARLRHPAPHVPFSLHSCFGPANRQGQPHDAQSAPDFDSPGPTRLATPPVGLAKSGPELDQPGHARARVRAGQCRQRRCAQAPGASTRLCWRRAHGACACLCWRHAPGVCVRAPAVARRLHARLCWCLALGTCAFASADGMHR